MLAMATTGELRQSSSNSAIDLSQLTVYEIVSAIHAVQDVEHRLHEEHVGHLGHLAEPVQVEDVHRRLAAYSSDMDVAVDQLPTTDPEKIRDVFTMLAGSGLIEDRKYAGSFIGLLTQVDRDYGLELWHRLLHDDHADVADAAWTPVESLLEDIVEGADVADKRLHEVALTRDDLLSLMNDYVRHLSRLRRDANDAGSAY